SDKWPAKVIAFRIGEQEYCVDVMSVWEIRCWTPATPLPHSPGFVRGVINLRGVVLPIIDLAARLGFPARDNVAQQVVIVARVGERTIGVLVDAVSDILQISPDLVQPPPDIYDPMKETFIRGVLVTEGRMISLICLENVLPAQERNVA
ncbi:MAG: chemotaxis protein CheW, partial [Hyphomicrobiales bacterium]|nr:chemotaxis protein CheW [Hyphomicrobiales bacterium]